MLVHPRSEQRYSQQPQGGRNQRVQRQAQAVVYMHNGILLSLETEILTYATTWVDLENVMLSERSPSQKGRYCMISFVGGT